MTESAPTRIYVDADACPVKDEIYKVAERLGLPVSVVANSFIRVPQHPLIERIVVGSGMDAADDWIAERVGPGDIVVTADVPLAEPLRQAGADGAGAERQAVFRGLDRHDAGDARPDDRPALRRAKSPAARAPSPRATARRSCPRSTPRSAASPAAAPRRRRNHRPDDHEWRRR